jgi:hypothetical protein
MLFRVKMSLTWLLACPNLYRVSLRKRTRRLQRLPLKTACILFIKHCSHNTRAS